MEGLFQGDNYFIQLRDVTHTFSRSLSGNKSTINPRFLVINKPSTPLHIGRMQLLVTFEPNENLKEKMSNLQVTIVHSLISGPQTFSDFSSQMKFCGETVLCN